MLVKSLKNTQSPKLEIFKSLGQPDTCRWHIRRLSILCSQKLPAFSSCNNGNSAHEDSGLKPHTYISGRWLRRDKLERDARCLEFDYDALCKRVLELCPSAVSIAGYEKKEGGYNNVFIFTCDNARRVVARLPASLAGPARLTTNSEVATIRDALNILDWSDDPSNAIGSEYIIMEHAKGVQLDQKWPTMSGEQQVSCIQVIMRNMQQVVALDFPAYGSIYHANILHHAVSTLPLTRNFCIGPHCGTRYWDCNVGESRYYNLSKANRGPWSNLTAYCDGLIDAGFSRLPAGEMPLPDKSPFQEPVAAHVRILDIGREVIRKLSDDSRIWIAATPTLYHADLNKRNIFVSNDDPTVVTDTIDWHSCSIEPAFEYADETPDFATPILNTSSANQAALTQADLCRQAFDVCLGCFTPRLYAARELDDDLLRPFRYCHRTWRDGAVAFRQELINISKRWKELNLSGSCPYVVPAADELLLHQKMYETFVFAQDLKQRLIYLLDTTQDGWVPTDAWEATKVAHKNAFDEIVQAIKDAESIGDETMSEENSRSIWPSDTE